MIRDNFLQLDINIYLILLSTILNNNGVVMCILVVGVKKYGGDDGK